LLLISETHAGPLRTWLDNFRPSSLFILDEAHHAAPSSGGPLSEGDVQGTRVTCPWHGADFDLKTGAVFRGSDGRLYNRRMRLPDNEPAVVVYIEPE